MLKFPFVLSFAMKSYKSNKTFDYFLSKFLAGHFAEQDIRRACVCFVVSQRLWQRSCFSLASLTTRQSAARFYSNFSDIFGPHV